LDNVVIPANQLVGKEGTGWSYGKFLLEHERFVISGVARSKRLLNRLIDLLKTSPDGHGGKLINSQHIRLKIASLQTQLTALEYTELRYLSDISAGNSPGSAASILKIRGTEIE